MDKLIEIASENSIWIAALGLIGIVVGVISFTIRFDFNKWLESRRESQISKLRALCPHCCVAMFEGKPGVESFFFTPAMSPYWICRRCQLQTLDSRLPEANSRVWVQDLKGLMAREKKFLKQARKLGLV